MKTKTINLSLLCLFIASYLLNSCTPHLMESFRHIDTFPEIIAAIFRWISLSSIAFIPLILLYNDKKALRLETTFVLPATLISLCFSNIYFTITKTQVFDIVGYVLYNLTIVGISIYLIIKNRKEHLLVKHTDFLFFFIALLMLMPLNIFMDHDKLVNNNSMLYKNFGIWYFVFMLIFIITSLALTKILYNQPHKEKIIFFLSIVLVYHLFTRFSYVRLYDYQSAHGIVGALPLYICSFGIILLPFAVYTKNHILQSFAFLINTPGAIIVLVNPTTGIVGIFHYDVIYFFFSHILLFAVTIQLAIYLKGKPKLKDVLHSGAFLFAYFMAMVVFNIFAESLSFNYNPNFSFVAEAPLPVDIRMFGQFKVWKSTFTPVYVLILWIIHWALAFVAFGGYNLFYSLHKKYESKKNLELKGA